MKNIDNKIKVMKDCPKKIDIFGYKYEFLIDGQEFYITKLGGSMTISFMIILVALFYSSE